MQRSATKAKTRERARNTPDTARDRILDAALQAFAEGGYAATSTLEIATRAQVSKRELYALFGNKQAMLAACIADRATRVRLPPDLPPARDRATLAQVLTQVGTSVLQEICAPPVITVFRLAIAEAQASPEVARALDRTGRQAVRSAVGQVIKQAYALGLLGGGEVGEMAGQFLALLWGDVMMSLLLGVRQTPTRLEARRRAEAAVTAFLRLHAAGNP
jgi:AcrR family transcriptional regulator